MRALLSIITPVYNVESYLDRCVQSILTQSFYDIELILIDDGSTDGSSALCDKWASKDSRVKVIHKDNGGVSSARNLGLEAVKGNYMTFVDPDDFLAQETYAPNMEFLAAHQEVDMLQYPYCHYISEDDILNYHKPEVALLIGTEQIFKNWWSGSPLEYVIWNKIYKRNLWDGVNFKVGHISEDTCLVPILVKRAKVAYISDHGLYYYQRERVDSYTFGEYDFNKHLDLFYAHATIYGCFMQFPDMVTEKVLAFTRLYRRLIAAKQVAPSADIRKPCKLVKKFFPTWNEIIASQGTEKAWLTTAKLLGPKLFVNLFLKYLNHC